MSARNRDVHRVGLIVGAITLIGLALSVAGALAWHSSVQDHQKQGFQSAAAEVSATAQTLLRRDTDFVATLNTVMSRQPNLGQSGFSQWYDELEGWQREVGSLGMTVVASVPAARLRSFLARRDGEPAFRALVGGEILPVRPDGQSHYCLISVAESLIGVLTGQAGRQVQENWCGASSEEIERSQGPLQNLATATGGLVAFPSVVDGVHTMFFERAFYRGGAETSTPAQRQGAVMGWVVSTFDVATLLNSALAGHKGLDVSLSHLNPGGASELMGQEGAAGVHGGYSFRSVANVEGPWTVTVHGSVATSGMSPGTQELLVLGIGAIMTLLVAALALVLTRSRERALNMVQEKTGELRHQALHDALTGLPNRVLALDRAEQMLARARRQNTLIAALYVDIDGFKHVNDSFGHAAGDELLRTVAARLNTVVRGADTAARLSGDEFIVLVESTMDAGPELVAERLLEALRRPYEVSGRMGRRLSLTASIGVCSGVRESADELLRDADLALYQAKANGRNCYALFESSMQTASQERLTLEMDLAEALEGNQLFLLYQPMFDLQSEAVTGVEALIRWAHPTRGTIPPADFIPIAERSGLIVPIGRWVLGEACRQAAGWQRDLQQLEISVNVSARQLDDDDLVDDVSNALATSGLDPALLTIEVTETTIMRDATATAARLRSLKELGVRIAIDDFGTGYSSLAYLSQFPADMLKIDRTFISEIVTSAQSAALIHTLIELGGNLHMQTLAEGIEEVGQLEKLREQHCNLGQGYLFSRPLQADDLGEFLQRAGQRQAALSA